MEEPETEEATPSVEMTGIINSSTLCRIFPFHILVDRKLHVVQYGQSLADRIHGKGAKLLDTVRVLEPDLPDCVTFDDILALQKSVFVLELRPEPADPDLSGSEVIEGHSLVLTGSVVGLDELDCVLFLTKPNVYTFEKLHEFDLELCDIRGHDPSRDLIIWNELYRLEKAEVNELSEKVERLQREIDGLQQEKALSNRLLHSILPSPVADQLRAGNSVEASRYQSVSILFSGICEFGGFCLNCRPIDVVYLLNDLYSQFDDLAQQPHRKIYKVETVGDKYMMVSGLPEKNADHADSIAMTALDMLDIGQNTTVSGYQIRLTLGVHSGEAVAGVVGQRMAHYAVFGGAVCQASRMESTGLADNVNISEATYKILKRRKDSTQKFCFKERGSLTMKGFAEPIKCYLLFRNQIDNHT